MSEPIISVSGLRGIIGDQLTPLVAMRYVAALASSLGAGEVVVGRDGRASGEMLFQTIASTLVGHGMTVIDLGVAATPTVGVAVREYGATAGIQISASHNPRQYNGLKLFAGSGRVLSKATGERVLASYQEGRSRWQGIDHLGKQMTVADPHARHLELVLDTVNVDLIRSRRFKVLLDSNCGAGSLLGRRLLDSLGCEVTILGDRPDGQFEHPPEPLAANLQAVCQRAIESGADITFCQDPDADRLAIIDQQGNYIGEEMTLALCLLSVLPQSPGPIVTNCATSSLSKHLARHFGVAYHQSAVGEANVVDEMLHRKAVFGGEGNGGPIDPRVGLVRDSFVGMARVLELLAERSVPLSQIVASLPPLTMVKDKISLPASKLPTLLDTLSTEMSAESTSRLDGLRLDWSDQWLLVRGSNTEPIVRLIAEAPTVAAAQQLCDQARRLADQL
ncbi:MAG: phosphoglucosamine mutase [Aureliella sp.]